MYYAPWCGHCKKLKPTWEELGDHVLGSDVIVAKLDATENKIKSLKIEGFPTIYFHPKTGEPIQYEGGRKVGDFKKYLYKNSEAYRDAFPEEDPATGGPAAADGPKSQEPQPDDEHVKVLVRSNHNEIVYDKSKDTLVMYYAPWCGHCKKLAPHWKDVAKEMQGSDVVIAKLDSTANEIDGLTIKSFPTIWFYPAGGERVAYDGGRDVEKIMTWL